MDQWSFNYSRTEVSQNSMRKNLWALFVLKKSFELSIKRAVKECRNSITHHKMVRWCKTQRPLSWWFDTLAWWFLFSRYLIQKVGFSYSAKIFYLSTLNSKELLTYVHNGARSCAHLPSALRCSLRTGWRNNGGSIRFQSDSNIIYRVGKKTSEKYLSISHKIADYSNQSVLHLEARLSEFYSVHQVFNMAAIDVR